jgi:hypothetical protein
MAGMKGHGIHHLINGNLMPVTHLNPDHYADLLMLLEILHVGILNCIQSLDVMFVLGLP